MFTSIYDVERMSQDLPKARQDESHNDRMVRIARADVKQADAPRKTRRIVGFPSRIMQLLRD